MREASTRDVAAAAMPATRKAFKKDGAREDGDDEEFAAVLISCRKGGTRMDRPAMPSMHAKAGMVRGKGAPGSVPRRCEVQLRRAANVLCENRMLTWLVPVIS